MFLESARRLLRNSLRNRYSIDLSQARNRQYQEQFAYGHREVLLDYAGLSRDLMFKAVISHGKILPHSLDPISPVYDIFDDLEIPQLLWRDDAVEDAKGAGVTQANSIGSPFLYALTNLGQSLRDTRMLIKSSASQMSLTFDQRLNQIANSKKITYLPLHSWEGDVNSHNIPQSFLLKELNPSRVTVCLGYLDFCDPIVRRLYEEIGWKVTCAGIRDSMIMSSPAGGREKFLYELTDIFSGSDSIIANEFTTGLFYAAAVGKHVAILSSVGSHYLSYSNWNTHASFQSLIEGPKQMYPWLLGEKFDSEIIEKDIQTALGILSFKEPNFFKTQVEKISVRSGMF